MTTPAVYSLAELSSFIQPLVKRYGMRGASLFGSYARGEADITSDIDVLLDAGDHFRALDIYAFGEDLRQATGKDVDVFERSELDESPFRSAVLHDEVAV